MAQQTINDGETGLVVRGKINDNFTELYAQAVSSGTYTPTATSVANLDSTPSPSVARWIRIGDIVHVSGLVTFDATLTGTFTQFRLSLPIASAFTTASGCAGCFCDANFGGEVSADGTNDEALFNFTPISTSTSTASYVYTYSVI